MAYVSEDFASFYLTEGHLVRTLCDCYPPHSGYHPLYLSRRLLPAAFAQVKDALRYRS